jgi:DNA polymerase III sliding clamp (beta) subunit (PCNA family)
VKVQAAVLISELQAIRIFAGEDESRWVLTGVLIEAHPDMTLIIATDGRRIAMMKSVWPLKLESLRPEKPVSFIMPVHLIDMLTPEGKHGREEIRNHAFITFDDELKSVSIEHYGGKYTVEGKVFEGAYPNWRNVIPTGEAKPVNALQLHADFIADYSKVHALLSREMPTLVLSQSESPDGPWSIRLHWVPNFYSVLMPVRSDSVSPSTPPAWVIAVIADKQEVTP